MAYGHAERNLAFLRQLEAETRQLLESLDQPDHEQSAWLREDSGQEMADEAGIAGRPGELPRSGATPALLVHEREAKPPAVQQNKVLLSERPVVSPSREPVTPRPPLRTTDRPGAPRRGDLEPGAVPRMVFGLVSLHRQGARATLESLA
jgi:hypothetical protein